MALFCFHSSRFDARLDQSGQQVIYKEQDKTKWDAELIQKGETYLRYSAKSEQVSKYHLEAGIAFWHSRIKVAEKDKWNNILQLYNRLLQIEYSPITALNRTYALAMAESKETALKEALKIDLKKNHLYHSLLAELYNRIDPKKQTEHLDLAIKLAKNENDKLFLISKREKAKG
jgi:RNA polymerase sigma-70 factor (ECF subfamily)